MNDKYELFEITPDVIKLKNFRKSYVDTLDERVIYKIVCNRANWFYYNKGIFDVKKILGSKFFEFSMMPDKSFNDKSIFDDFIEYGVSNIAFIKAVRDLSRTYYFYIPNNSLDKVGRRYVATPIIPLSEDVYNLCLLSLKDFRKLETQDISKYSDFFAVSDKPNFIIDKNRLRYCYESGKLSLEEFNNIVEMFEKEERLVRSLRR